LLTVGHGTLDRAGLQRLLQDAGVDMVVDVRRYPNSSPNADVGREALERWLPAAGIDYRWDERLGGRRHLPPRAVEIDTWWTVAAFRAYAAYTRSEEFAAGWADLHATVQRHEVVLMCSETLWWRCHRRLIADVATLAHELPVTPAAIRPPRAAPTGRRRRLAAEGRIIWDRSAAND
jgi:uncharacterized protein (DUF488 family)